MSARTCGECAACCHVYDIPDILNGQPKPARTPCPFLAVAPACGCGIYATRPQVCQDFQCLWLTNPPGLTLREEERPDKLGIVFAASHSPFSDATGIIPIAAHETTLGSAETSYWQMKVLKRLAKQHLIYVRRPGDARRVMGPPLLVATLTRFKAEFDAQRARAADVPPTGDTTIE